MDTDEKGKKIVKISEMGDVNFDDINFSDYADDTIFVLDDLPLRDPRIPKEPTDK